MTNVWVKNWRAKRDSWNSNSCRSTTLNLSPLPPFEDTDDGDDDDDDDEDSDSDHFCCQCLPIDLPSSP